MFSDGNTIFEFRGPFGVPIQISSSFLMLAAFIVLMGGGMASLPYQIAFVGMIFVSILLHELGHAWGCIVQGIPVERIVIHGGGGYCLPARQPERHQDEFIVALGPIVNLGLWAVASLLVPFMADPLLFWGLSLFALINLFLAVMNMIPVMPLDGGKLFQYGLRRFVDNDQARRIAGGVGVVIGVLWIPAMLYFYVYLGFVLLFFPSIHIHWQMLRS
jgi:Zn-dependent protease